jgi:hypothetical protein
MAYSSTNPPLMIDDGLGPNCPRTFSYQSTHTSTEILATGFFVGVGAGSRGLYGVGMRVGDLLVNRASTDSSIGGRVTWHSVISATADQASTLASSGWVAAYNATVASAT